MALSKEGRDILNLLPSETYVEVETDYRIELEVAPDFIIDGELIQHMCRLYRHGSAEPVRCSIDFLHRTIQLRRGGVVVVERCSRASGLTAVTESERAAVNAADQIGVIDHDDLIPTFAMETDDAHTTLMISGLVHISHDALLHGLRDLPQCGVQYNMGDSTVSVRLPRANKRKR